MEKSFSHGFRNYLEKPFERGINIVISTSIIYSLSLMVGIFSIFSKNEFVKLFGLATFLLVTIIWSQWVFWEHRGPKWSLFRSGMAVLVFFTDFCFWTGVSNNEIGWFFTGLLFYTFNQLLIWWNPKIREAILFT